MAEASVFGANASVNKHDPASFSWVPGDTGMSRVDLYFNSQANTYRIIAVDAQSGEFCVNSAITSTVTFDLASPIFGQWTDAMNDSYGLNFLGEEEASMFKGAVDQAVAKLRAPPPSAGPARGGMMAGRGSILATTGSVGGRPSVGAAGRGRGGMGGNASGSPMGPGAGMGPPPPGDSPSPFGARGGAVGGMARGNGPIGGRGGLGSPAPPADTPSPIASRVAARGGFGGTPPPPEDVPAPTPFGAGRGRGVPPPEDMPGPAGRGGFGGPPADTPAPPVGRGAPPPPSDVPSPASALSAALMSGRGGGLAGRSSGFASKEEEKTPPKFGGLKSSAPEPAPTPAPSASKVEDEWGNPLDNTPAKIEPPKETKKDSGLSSSLKGPSKPEIVTASNSMAGNAASAAGGAAGQAVSREDLEQFKREIFDYIDRAKREILDALSK